MRFFLNIVDLRHIDALFPGQILYFSKKNIGNFVKNVIDGSGINWYPSGTHYDEGGGTRTCIVRKQS